MHIDVIDQYDAFFDLRENWEAVYDADPDAQYFLSWLWLSEWLEKKNKEWLILAAKTDADASSYVAFLPLRMKVRMKRGGGFYNEIIMAGRAYADYSGLICRPEHEAGALAALANHLKKLHWTELNLDFIRISPERLRLLLSHFPNKAFKFSEVEEINKRDNIDNCICPYAALPSDWDEYLNRLSSNTRQKLKRFLRQLDKSDELRITHATADTVDDDLRSMLRFWGRKWAQRKGNRLQGLLNNNFRMMLRCFHNGTLLLPVLWKGEERLGALSIYVDARKRSLLFFMAARDETFNNPPPGLLLHAHTIRYAISQGFTTYDFLRGNEAYKYSFGVDEWRLKHIVVSTRNGRNLGQQLDERTLPTVLRRTLKLHQDARLAEAERGYRQILDANPRSASALYGYGQLMATRGNHAAAEKSFRALVAIKPDARKAWLRLAASLEARHQFEEAAEARREANKHRPELAAGYRKHASVLAHLGKADGPQLTALESALDLQAAARRPRKPNGSFAASTGLARLRRI